MLTSDQLYVLRRGAFIPAVPLALDAERQLDAPRQRALVRYYLAAGVDGLAVGVHTTQFAIRQKGLYEPVLRIAAETVAAEAQNTTLLVAGVVGPTEQAVAEAVIARDLGYDMVLLSCGSLPDYTEDMLIARARRVADVLPVFGFYLQPAAGGRLLSRDYWKKLADLDNVLAIKMAPFNRYQTLDVVSAVCHSDRCEDITLYTGNDDNIIVDLLSPYRIQVGNHVVEKRIVGGLLGHWSVWTQKAVAYYRMVRELARRGDPITPDLLAFANQVTDANAVFFDAANNFDGCIAGLHAILTEQGILAGRWTLDPAEDVSPGQLEEIGRIKRDYPHLCDDAFVAANVEKWLKG